MLHFSTGIHQQSDSAPATSHRAGASIQTVTVALAAAIRHQWVSVGALAIALFLVTDLGTNIVLVAPLLAALAVLVNAVIDPAGAEAFATTDVTEKRV